MEEKKANEEEKKEEEKKPEESKDDKESKEDSALPKIVLAQPLQCIDTLSMISSIF